MKAGKRLAAGKLAVVDAQDAEGPRRKCLLRLARAHDCAAVVIAFEAPDASCARPGDRRVPADPVCQVSERVRVTVQGLRAEGFRQVYMVRPADLDHVVVTRRRPPIDRRHDRGPFDIIGDVHGCRQELSCLLETLGYVRHGSELKPVYRHPAGRRLVLLGDLVDRGPDVPGVLRIAMNMVDSGSALCVRGNHEAKLLRKLQGRNVRLTHGLAESVEQLDREPEAFRQRVTRFLDGLVSHYVLDAGRLVVAHAGLTEALQGRTSGRVFEFALYGDTSGETDEYGLPVRRDWARDYRGSATVVYGHTPVHEARWVNGTVCVDTGCVFGGKLTALRYPERVLVSVPAARVYCEPRRPLQHATAAQERV